jgi:spore photoproduct lyase
LRINIYRKMIGFIRKHAPDTVIYLCMEDEEVWKKSMGVILDDVGGLPQMLDMSVVRHCNLNSEGIS